MTGDGYGHVNDVRHRRGHQDVNVIWQGENAGLSLFMAGVAGADIFAGQTPGNPLDSSYSTVICRQRNAGAVFRTVFHPYAERPLVRSVIWHGGDLFQDGWTTCTVDIGGRQEHWQVRQHAQIAISPSAQAAGSAQTFDYTLESLP
jgi:hypothetical protein